MTPKQTLIITLAGVGIALLLGSLLWSVQSAPPPLKFAIVRRTHDSVGAAKVTVEVLNSTRRIQNYAYWAQLPTSNGWAAATNWESQHPGRLHWIEAGRAIRFALSAPEGAAVWRLKFMREPQPNALEWKWYGFVRWAGLKRVGMREGPAHSYFFTDPMTQ